MSNIKYALLDTDFISKTHLINKGEKDRLIDCVLKLPNYQFYCHKQIVLELKRHSTTAPDWLNERITDGSIVCYTDEEILAKLYSIYGNSCCVAYINLLENACNAFSSDYFDQHYPSVKSWTSSNFDREMFLEALNSDDRNIGEGKNLGEIKSYVVLQMLSRLYGEEIFVFCSDDKNARNGILNFDNTRCISVLSAFLRLRLECDVGLETAAPYINSYIQFCHNHKQSEFRVWEANQNRMCKVPCEQVFQEIYKDKFIELQNGMLKYKSQ